MHLPRTPPPPPPPNILDTEPVFAKLLRSLRIDSQPGGPVRQPYLPYRPARLHRFLESIPGLLKRLQSRALMRKLGLKLRLSPLKRIQTKHSSKITATVRPKVRSFHPTQSSGGWGAGGLEFFDGVGGNKWRVISNGEKKSEEASCEPTCLFTFVLDLPMTLKGHGNETLLRSFVFSSFEDSNPIRERYLGCSNLRR